MKAILSDIHGNLEALQAVLEDIGRHRVEGIYCLGDLVGYGPNPRECVDLAMQWDVALLGNFDLAVRFQPPQVGLDTHHANRSLRWSQQQLDVPVPTRQAAERRWAFLRGLPRQHFGGDFTFVHGSPVNPVNEYVFPEDIHNGPKMRRLFDALGRYCLQGHTHIPGIFTANGRFLSPHEIGHVHRLDGRKAMCNVGSVGQPRDGDWRSSYALLDGETIRFRRLPYDLEATVRKIRAVDDLDDWLGERLRDGR